MEGLWAQKRPEDQATAEAFDRNPELVFGGSIPCGG